MTYGAIRIEVDELFIECEPHVRSRLRRVFARVDQSAGNGIALSPSPENCRDLVWFLERYPMTVSAEAHAVLTEGETKHVDRERRLADLLSGKTPVEPIKLRKPARGYQLFAAQACEIRGGLLLADDVGVGKTVSGLLPMAKPQYIPAVVVCESHLLRQIEGALNEFLSGRVVHRIRKGTPYDLLRESPQTQLRANKLPDVFVISYHMLRGWADQLGEIAEYVVFDEVQRLRHHGSQIYVAAQWLARKAKMNMGLSATPIYNYGSEFFWVIDALLPGSLGTRQEFVREWCGGGGDKARIADAEDFGSFLRREGIMLRRTRKDVAREIPPVQRLVQAVETDPKVIDELTGDAIDLARIILRHNEKYRGERMQASAELDNMMRQATGIAKAPYIAEFVKLLLESGEKVLLFGWHRAVYRIWAERLAAYKPMFYTGHESPSQKQGAIDAFLSKPNSRFGSSDLLIMSLRSGAGVDGLQACCRTAVVGELDWSPGVHDQCVGRIARDGQTDPVMAYFLVSDEGSDPIVADVCGVKFEQREGVINPGGPLVARVDTGEHHIRRIAESLLRKRGETFNQEAER